MTTPSPGLAAPRSARSGAKAQRAGGKAQRAGGKPNGLPSPAMAEVATAFESVSFEPRLSLAALVRAGRPKQWAKNVLVFGAPAAAGVLTHRGPLVATALTFIAFCICASGVYYFNDIADRESDMHHPKKRFRPIASGQIPIRLAQAIALVLTTGAILFAWATVSLQVALVVMLYVCITLAYTYSLKQQPVIDLAGVSSGFVLRAVAGGFAAGVPLSQWFLIVITFGALFIVAAKRHVELVELGDEGGAHRATLETYSTQFLRGVQLICASVAILAYCLWAFEKQATGAGPWFELSAVPVVLGLFQYDLLVERNGIGGSAPEDLILGSKSLFLLGLAWAALVAAGVYAH